MIHIEFNYDFNKDCYNKQKVKLGIKILEDIACAYQKKLVLDVVEDKEYTLVKHTFDLDEITKNAIIEAVRETCILKNVKDKKEVNVDIIFQRI